MNRFTLTWLPILLIVGPGIPTQAQGTDWQTLNTQVVSLSRQGLYDRAMAAAKKALWVAEQTNGPDHPLVALSLNNLALLYKTRGWHAERLGLALNRTSLNAHTLAEYLDTLDEPLTDCDEIPWLDNRTVFTVLNQSLRSVYPKCDSALSAPLSTDSHAAGCPLPAGH